MCRRTTSRLDDCSWISQARAGSESSGSNPHVLVRADAPTVTSTAERLRISIRGRLANSHLERARGRVAGGIGRRARHLRAAHRHRRHRTRCTDRGQCSVDVVGGRRRCVREPGRPLPTALDDHVAVLGNDGRRGVGRCRPVVVEHGHDVATVDESIGNGIDSVDRDRDVLGRLVDRVVGDRDVNLGRRLSVGDIDHEGRVGDQLAADRVDRRGMRLHDLRTERVRRHVELQHRVASLDDRRVTDDRHGRRWQHRHCPHTGRCRGAVADAVADRPLKWGGGQRRRVVVAARRVVTREIGDGTAVAADPIVVDRLRHHGQRIAFGIRGGEVDGVHVLVVNGHRTTADHGSPVTRSGCMSALQPADD